MGWFLGDNHDGPEELRWITDLEHKRRPPLNTLFNICANYVANHLEDTVLTVSSITPGLYLGSSSHKNMVGLAIINLSNLLLSGEWRKHKFGR